MPMTFRSVSVVVPVHNERGLARSEVLRMRGDFNAIDLDYELLIVENGSTDGTFEILEQLAQEDPHIVLESLPQADYGLALKRGILRSTKDIVVIFNLELRDMEFLRLCLNDLPSYDLIIASKMMPGGRDERPFLRRLTSRGFNLLLKWIWGFRGTDTHGMKVFWREPMASLACQVVTDGFIFETELVLRAERMGFRIKEIPVQVKELRLRSAMSLLRRVPGTLTNLWKLFWTLERK
jgi:glycosyltransferase involved in cell wall biosynthesis